MKTILIPTDFSENAANAFRYGIAFAKKYLQKLFFIMSFTFQLMLCNLLLRHLLMKWKRKH